MKRENSTRCETCLCVNSFLEKKNQKAGVNKRNARLKEVWFNIERHLNRE